jgi:beta-N-acetylhexosaminidase
MLVIGIAGMELAAHEREWLDHPGCAGVILFSRNFASREQVTDLTRSIRESCKRPLLICVDQEGGRVQRFRDGYADSRPGKFRRALPA